MRRRACSALLAASVSASVLVAALPATAAAATVVTPTRDAGLLAEALEVEAGTVVGGRWGSLPGGQPAALLTGPLAGFPRGSGEAVLLTSGSAAFADDANTSDGTGIGNGGGAQRGDTAEDVVVLAVDLQVPADVNCLVGFDFRFLSEEFPEYVGSRYNDGFIAELDRSTWTTQGSAIVAPDNFAFDPDGQVISINSVGLTAMTPQEAAGTTYDGATPLLSAATPITPGAHTLFLSIFDQGDSVLDSAVLLDALRFGRVADVARDCRPGAQQAVAGIPLGQSFGTTGGYSPGYAVNPYGYGADPVNTATGAYSTRATDAVLASPGRPLVLERSYTSADETVGPLGRGWTHALAASLQLQPSGDVLARAGSGQQVIFSREGDGFRAPAGARAELTRTAQGFRLVLRGGLVQDFDGEGRLLAERDRYGNGTTLGHDSAGRLALARATSGRTLTFTSRPDGLLSEVRTGDGRTVSFAYEGGLLSAVTDTLGGTVRYRYDGGLLVAIEDQRGKGVLAQSYDEQGRVVEQTDGAGVRTTLAYDGPTTTVTDGIGGQQRFVHDDGRLVSRTDELGGTASFTYDEDLALTSYTDRAGRRVEVELDDAGRAVALTGPGGIAATVEYQQDDAVATTDALGRRTSSVLDAGGGVVETTEPGGVSSSAVRGARGQVVGVTDPAGGVLRLAYDEEGDLTSTTTAGGARTGFEHDAAGRVVRATDASGVVTALTRDAADHVVAVTDGLGGTTRTSYDSAGLRTSVTDAAGRRTVFAYDGAARLVAVTAPDGGTTRYAYDAAGRLVARTDALDRRTEYELDAAGRVEVLRAPAGRTWTYSYDDAGNLAAVTDANGNATPDAGDGTTRYDYDAADRLVAVDLPGSTPDVSLTYDASGALVQMTDGDGTQSREYDDAGRLVEVSRDGRSFAYAYDALGNVVRRTAPGGATTAYAYDADGRLTQVEAGGVRTTYGYDPAGRLLVRTTGTSTPLRETSRYDAAGRLVARSTSQGAVLLEDVEAQLDPTGLPLVLKSRTRTQTWSYDGAGRLAGWCGNKNCSQSLDVSHDLVGNRVREVAREEGTGVPVTSTWAYDDADRPTGAGAPAFDANGNQLTLDGQPARYDGANRLVSLGRGPGAVAFGYDGEGNRTSSTRDGRTTSLLWDVNAGLPQLAVERGESGAVHHVFGDAALGLVRASGSSWFVRDGLGSITDVVDARGKAEWSYAYTPDGVQERVQRHGQAPANPVGFAGELVDPTSGLVDLRARTYDPRSGRFLQRDPASAAFGVPVQSAYAYADGRPNALTDPSGECPFCVLAAVGGAVGGVLGGAAYAATTDDFTWRGLAGASASGAVAGAVGAVAGPLAGTIAKGVGSTASGALATGLAGGINFGVGAGATWLGGALGGYEVSALDALAAGVGGAFGGAVAGRYLPVPNQTSLRQAARFGPRTWRGSVPGANRTISALYGNTALGGALGGLVGAVPSFFDPAGTGAVRK